MNTRFSTRKIILDSRDSKSVSGGSYFFKIDDLLRGLSKDQIEWLSVDSAEIPNVFYNVVAGRNNTFELEVYLPDLVTLIRTLTVVVPEGNYTSTVLVDTLKTVIDAADGVDTYTVAISPLTGELSITNDTGNGVKLVYANSTMGNVLGFRGDSAIAVTITSDSIVDLRGITSVFITSNLPEGFIKATGTGMSTTTFLQEIKMTEGFGNTVFYEAGNDLQTFRVNSIPTTLSVGLRSRNNEILDTHGLHWKITILIHFFEIQ